MEPFVCWSKNEALKSFPEELNVDRERSLIYNRKRSGPMTMPRGTLEGTGKKSKEAPFDGTRWLLCVRKPVI